MIFFSTELFHIHQLFADQNPSKCHAGEVKDQDPPIWLIGNPVTNQSTLKRLKQSTVKHILTTIFTIRFSFSPCASKPPQGLIIFFRQAPSLMKRRRLAFEPKTSIGSQVGLTHLLRSTGAGCNLNAGITWNTKDVILLQV